jgi:hypothetical protein
MKHITLLLILSASTLSLAGPKAQFTDFLSQYCLSLEPLDRDTVSSLRLEFCKGFVAKPTTYGQLTVLMNHIAAKTGEAVNSHPQLVEAERKQLIRLQDQAEKMAGDFLYQEASQALNPAEM